MDYVEWEENYGKRRVTKRDLVRKQVLINDLVRQIRRELKKHDFKTEMIKDISEDYRTKVMNKTGHINFITAEFEQILVEHHKLFKNLLSVMLSVNEPRWKNKRRIKKDAA